MLKLTNLDATFRKSFMTAREPEEGPQAMVQTRRLFSPGLQK